MVTPEAPSMATVVPPSKSSCPAALMSMSPAEVVKFDVAPASILTALPASISTLSIELAVMSPDVVVARSMFEASCEMDTPPLPVTSNGPSVVLICVSSSWVRPSTSRSSSEIPPDIFTFPPAVRLISSWAVMSTSANPPRFVELIVTALSAASLAAIERFVLSVPSMLTTVPSIVV